MRGRTLIIVVAALFAFFLVDHVARVSGSPYRPMRPILWGCEKISEYNSIAIKYFSQFFMWATEQAGTLLKAIILTPLRYLRDTLLWPIWDALLEAAEFFFEWIDRIFALTEMKKTLSEYAIALSHLIGVPLKWTVWWALGFTNEFYARYPIVCFAVALASSACLGYLFIRKCIVGRLREDDRPKRN